MILMACWSGFGFFELDATSHWVPLLTAFGIAPLAWRLRSRVLLVFALIMFQFATVLAVVGVNEELSIPVSFFLSVFYIIVGLLVVDTGFADSRRVFKYVGFIGYFVFVYVFSFPDGAGLLDDIEFTDSAAIGYLSVLLVIVTVAWVRVLVTRHTRLDWFWRWQWGLVAISSVFVAGGCLGWIFTGWVLAIPMNLIFLAHSVFFIVQGGKEANAKLVSIVCLLFSVLVVTRYVDLFESLLVRSLIFLLLGAGLFLVGTFYSRLRKRDAQVPS